jgi:uncharacterized phage protein (TIGR01671 family)
MRSIKFKAKRVDNGEWVYGYYFKCNTYNKTYIYNLEVLQVRHEVIPKTVCQFTGLKDKKGNDIYEGDIVDMKSLKSNAYSFTIYYDKGRYFLYCNEFKERINWGDLYRQQELRNELIITGNIHDKK